MKHMLWSNSIKLWKGDSKTRFFPFDMQAKREAKNHVSGIDYRLTKKLLTGGCVDILNDSYIVNMSESLEAGTLKYPKDDLSPALLEKEELMLYITTRFRDE
jgi:hypothetical protein